MKKILYLFLLACTGFGSVHAQSRDEIITDLNQTGAYAHHFRAVNGVGVGIRPVGFDANGNLVVDTSISGNFITSIAGNKITGTPGGVGFFDLTGHLATSTNFQWDYTNNRLNIGGTALSSDVVNIATNSTGGAGITATNINTSTTSASVITVLNSAGIGGGIASASPNFFNPYNRNKLTLSSNMGIVIQTDNAQASGGADSLLIQAGGTQVTPFAFAPSGDLIVPGRLIAGGVILGTGTTYTDFKEEFTSQTTTTKTLLHTPAFPAATLLFYNNGNGYSIQSSAWYSISGSTLTLNFTPASTDKFIIKYSY